MPQNKITNPAKATINKDPNLSNIENPLFPNTGTMLSVGALEEINRLKNPIKSISSKLPEPETPSTFEDDSQSRFLASLLGQGAAMFGGAIAGRDPMKIAEQFTEDRFLQDKMTQSNEQRKSAIEQAKNLMNPDSEESKRKRLVYERALGIKIPGEFSASDLEDRNVLQGLVAQSQPKQVPGRVGGGVQKKESLAKNPFYKEIILTSNMGNSVDSDLKELSDLIKKSGNSPLFGPDKLRQQQLVNQIAINYNKILDPSSVVREAESGAVIKNLGLEWLTRSDVSKEAIDQFRNSVDKTVNNNIKGYYGMYSTFSPEEEQIAEDFKNNPNDPKISEAYSNLLSLKRKGVR